MPSRERKRRRKRATSLEMEACGAVLAALVVLALLFGLSQVSTNNGTEQF